MSGMPSEEFDALVAEVMTEWQISGLAMAVERKDEPPLLLRCWGLRDIETGAPAGPATVFPICSVTKSFTATGLALLVDEGKLDWDTPAREILPEFRLRDPVASEQAALRDLLTRPLTGVYRIGNIVFRIGIDQAGRITFTRNEAAAERLLARHGSIFGFADSEFFRIEFRRNAAGQVDALLSHEPTGTYLAERDTAPR